MTVHRAQSTTDLNSSFTKEAALYGFLRTHSQKERTSNTSIQLDHFLISMLEVKVKYRVLQKRAHGNEHSSKACLSRMLSPLYASTHSLSLCACEH